MGAIYDAVRVRSRGPEGRQQRRLRQRARLKRKGRIGCNRRRKGGRIACNRGRTGCNGGSPGCSSRDYGTGYKVADAAGRVQKAFGTVADYAAMVAEDGDTAALHYRKIYILPLIAQHNGFFDGYERFPGKIPNRITNIIPNRFPGKTPNRFPSNTLNRFPRTGPADTTESYSFPISSSTAASTLAKSKRAIREDILAAIRSLQRLPMEPSWV